MLTVRALGCFRTKEARAIDTTEQLVGGSVQCVSKVSCVVRRSQDSAEVTLLQAS
jgi:hypothetical protein